MSYRHVVGSRDYSDVASGFVLRSAPGYPAFPVRLAEEIFLRAAARRPAGPPIGLWDPCCGSGYLATVLGLLHRDRLASVLGTDADPEAVALAGRNLSLLSEPGLAERRGELTRRSVVQARAGQVEAAAAAYRLGTRLRAGGGDLPARVAEADVGDPGQLATAINGGPLPSVVITDIPYGRQTDWAGSLSTADDPIAALVRSLCEVLADDAIVALCAQTRKISLGAPALEHFRVGHRAVFIGRVADLRPIG
jgi:hypothetical protein